MAKCVVLLIGPEQSTIVTIIDGVEHVTRVESPPKGKGADERQGPRRDHCRKVVAAIQGAQEIFIFGTAQAKLALKSELLKDETLWHRIVGSETADQMTERQLVARAREICGTEER